MRKDAEHIEIEMKYLDLQRERLCLAMIIKVLREKQKRTNRCNRSCKPCSCFSHNSRYSLIFLLAMEMVILLSKLLSIYLNSPMKGVCHFPSHAMIIYAMLPQWTLSKHRLILVRGFLCRHGAYNIIVVFQGPFSFDISSTIFMGFFFFVLSSISSG